MDNRFNEIKMLLQIERPLLDSTTSVIHAVLTDSDFMLRQSRSFSGDAKILMQEVAINMRRDAELEIAMRN